MATWVEDNFKKLEKSLNGQASSSFHSVRKEALARFSKLGFPSSKDEDWKYTNLSPVAKGSFSLVDSSGDFNEQDLAPYAIADLNSYRLVFVDGHFKESLSVVGELSKGAVICSIASELKSNAFGQKDFLEKHLATQASYEEQALVALNTALLHDGVLVKLAKGTVLERPVEVIFLTSKNAKEVSTNARVFIAAEKETKATVIERFIGLSEQSYFTSVVSEALIAENANIKHVRIQEEGSRACHFSSVQHKQDSNSVFATHSFALGGSLVRNEVYPTLCGENIDSTLNGLSVLEADQHVDNYTVIDHAKPHSQSNELYKGIYADKSSGAFSGTIIVRPDAQKTNAIQSNNSLLLSPEASVDAKPQLKIWADDVRCTHGATIGQIDEDALFYLRARGIPKDRARNMLIKAFAIDVLEQLDNEPIRAYVEQRMYEKLDRVS